LGGGLLMAVIGYPAVLAVFGTRFVGAYSALVLLIPGLMALSVIFPFANLLSSRGEALLNAAIFGAGATANVVLNLVLVPRLGIKGAAASSSICYVAVSICFVLLLSRRYSLSPRAMLVLRREEATGLFRRLGLKFTRGGF
jgi:O-antigen/teichoic acid export membrane protein